MEQRKPFQSTSEKRCMECNGTGKDAAKTEAMYKREFSATGYIACRACMGNGLDPAKFFRWSNNESKN